jgi:hypothetical protein
MFIKSSFKLIFDILFFLVIINSLGAIFMMFINGFDISLANTVYKPQRQFSNWLYLGAINEIIFSIVFVIVAYHLRKVAKVFIVDGEFKSFGMVKHLKRSGQFLVIIGICLIIKKIFLIYHFDTTHHFFQSNSLIYLLIIVIGLSLIRLSKMLQLSIQAKQEQDLTI